MSAIVSAHAETTAPPFASHRRLQRGVLGFGLLRMTDYLPPRRLQHFGEASPGAHAFRVLQRRFRLGFHHKPQGRGLESLVMRLSAFAVLLLVVAVLPPSAPALPDVMAVTLTVDGEAAHGLVAFPSGPCSGVAVIAHGLGHTASSHTTHLANLAGHGLVAIAMDYRGPQAGFPLANGAADTIAATHFAKANCPGKPAYFYSVSMGTAVAALVLPQIAQEFDYWVNNEGLANLFESWSEARAVCPAVAFACPISVSIEHETGGTPVEQPEAFAARSAALRAHEMTALKGVILTHGLNDGMVPYNQGREMVTALRAAGIPSDFYTVVRGEPGGEGTTLTGHASHSLDNGFAGHGTESNDAHTLTALSFSLFTQIATGHYGQPSNAEFVVDGTLGTLP